MSTVGLIGGIAPASTVDYYQRIIDRYRERRVTDVYPSIIVNSIRLNEMVAHVTSGRLDDLTEWLLRELERLRAAGADFAALASNTPHIVFDRLRARSGLELLSIVEATCARARSLDMHRVGLLGTRYTMEAGFYQAVFAAVGLEVVVPAPDEREFVHGKYMDELIRSVFADATRDGFVAVMRALQERERLDAVILGGTELPILLRDSDVGCPLLDTTTIHVDAIVERLVQLEGTPA